MASFWPSRAQQQLPAEAAAESWVYTSRHLPRYLATASTCAPESQRDMHTADDTAWLRSLSRGKRSLAGAAGTGLDGMRRAKASKAPAADGKGPGGMPDADSPAAGTRARARHACGRPRALALDALADGDAESPATADDLSAPPPPMTATTSAPLPSSGSMHGMTLTQLRDMARAHGIPAAGSKTELIRALLVRARAAVVTQVTERSGRPSFRAGGGASPTPAANQSQTGGSEQAVA